MISSFLQAADGLGRVKHDQHWVIGVKEHKTAAAEQVAAFALLEEEARVSSSHFSEYYFFYSRNESQFPFLLCQQWFDVSFRLVRPQLLRATKKRKRDVEDESDAAERFFVSSTGRAVYNPSNDLMLLHSK